jgi:membrane associated rhomboid family serine protease
MGSDVVAPASRSQNLARTAGSAAASADDPTVQVVQCVVDFRWHARSWCPKGISAAARMYRPRTTLNGRPRDPRGSRPEVNIVLPIIRATPVERKTAPPADYTFQMFPISDVIPSRTTPYVTVGLMVLNGLVFLYELQLTRPELQLFAQVFGIVPAYFSWPTLVTSMFIHEGWMHLFGNMLYLWIFGDNVEDRIGHFGYLLFYLASGSAAALGQLALSPGSTIPMIGASGAIAGVMGAYFVLYPHSRVLTVVFLVFFMDMVEIPAIFFLGIWFVKELLSGVGSLGTLSVSGGVAFWAHVIGFAVGALTGMFWRVREPPQRSYWA